LPTPLQPEHNHAARDEVKRVELRTYIDSLIRATQLAEEAASHHQDDAALKGHAASEMWIAYKALSLISGETLRDTAASYCDELNSCLWSPTSTEPWRPDRRLAAEVHGGGNSGHEAPMTLLAREEPERRAPFL